MKILGHIHTFNEGRVIDRTVKALLGQTYPVTEVLLVDNASTDNTLDRHFPDGVMIERFEENRLTSDPIIHAMKYANDHDFDWVWLLNGDTAPRPDCLQGLVDFISGLDEQTREHVWLVSALPLDVTTAKPDEGYRVTANGLKQITPGKDEQHYECDATIWSGSMYKVAAIREVGYPRSDYAMDMAEIEYGYRGSVKGYRAFMCRSSVADHNVDGPSLQATRYQVGPFSFQLPELQPFRCYYVVRNVLHFWLYLFRGRTLRTYVYCFGKVIKLSSMFLLRPLTHRRQVAACMRGIRDGVFRRLSYRYPV